MPVTAKLSKKFYDTLGDEVTNELVAWLNAVDESYREEFRDLFAANFGRLEAEMRAFKADVEAKLDQARSEAEGRFLVVEIAACHQAIDALLGHGRPPEEGVANIPKRNSVRNLATAGAMI